MDREIQKKPRTTYDDIQIFIPDVNLPRMTKTHVSGFTENTKVQNQD